MTQLGVRWTYFAVTCAALLCLPQLVSAQTTPPAVPVPVANPAPAAQSTPPRTTPRSFGSPQIAEDGKLTFRLRAPAAKVVKVSSGDLEDALGAPLPAMEQNNGTWSVTVGPVAPGIYDYAFDVDGVKLTDPASRTVFGGLQGSRGYVDVPSPAGQFRHDEWRDVPHGAIHTHWYAALDPKIRRRVHVYTPPGYGKDLAQKYPVVYLLHGSGDNDSHWTLLGQANVIADNLIADGKMVPSIIVMPDGHAPLEPKAEEAPEARRSRARGAFEAELLERVMPLVEQEYRVGTERQQRAIVGLSMGGGQSLQVGLNQPEKFAWVGGFSSAVSGQDPVIAKLKNPETRGPAQELLWIGIGNKDFLLDRNRQFVAALEEIKIPHEYHETAGAHRWGVWRQYLHDFLPRLFKPGEKSPAP